MGEPFEAGVQLLGGARAALGRYRSGGPLLGQLPEQGLVATGVGGVDPAEELLAPLLLRFVLGKVGVGLAGQLAVELAGLLAGPHPLRGPYRLVGEHGDGLREQAVTVHPAVQQLLHARDRHHLGAGLRGAADVLGVAGAGGLRLGDLRVQLLDAAVERAESLFVEAGEVLDLDAEGLHGDLVLDQRLLGGPYGLFQPFLGTRGLGLVGFRGCHPPRVAVIPPGTARAGRQRATGVPVGAGCGCGCVGAAGAVPRAPKEPQPPGSRETVPHGPGGLPRHTPSSASIRPVLIPATSSAWSASVRSA